METGLLAKRVKTGDKDALVELIMGQSREYYKLAYAFLGNREDALDAMEDMVVIIYEKLHQLKKMDSFTSWSKTILVNCCRKQLRNRNKTVPLFGTLEERASESELKQSEDYILLEGGLGQLSEKHQEVIRLRYFLDYDYETISRVLKVPLGTVKSRLAAGLKQLKESLGGEDHA